MALSDIRPELFHIISLCANVCKWHESRPHCLLIYATTIVLSILTSTCCPLRKGHKCFSATETARGSKQFIRTNCIYELHVSFTILPSYSAQLAREASMVIYLCISVHLPVNRAKMHTLETKTWWWLWCVRFSLSDVTHCWCHQPQQPEAHYELYHHPPTKKCWTSPKGFHPFHWQTCFECDWIFRQA